VIDPETGAAIWGLQWRISAHKHARADVHATVALNRRTRTVFPSRIGAEANRPLSTVN